MAVINRREMLALSGVTALGSLLGGAAGAAENSEPLKVMVVGAHPDDPETGCGGTMALLAQAGHEVVSVYLTRGEAGIEGKSHDEAARIRTAEAEKACRILGARPLFLGQIDGSCVITPPRYQEMTDLFLSEKPDMLLSHWPIDTHRDHRICSILVYDAWLNLGRKCPLYYYEVMSGHQTSNFSPTHYVDITSVLQKKHAACFAHVSQNIEKEYMDDHGQMERFRGLEFTCDHAEAFVLHVQSPRGSTL